MESIAYNISAALKAALAPSLARPAEAAAIAVARLDERLERSEPTLAEGFYARANMFDAQAIIALAGGLASLEDIVLHDAGMDIRAPTLEVLRAASAVRLRRSLARRDPGDVLAVKSLRGLLGMPEGQGGQEAVPAAMTQTTADPPLARHAAPAAPRPWDMPGFGEADADDGDRERDDGGDTHDPDAPDLEPLDPGGAPDDHLDAAGAEDFAELDTLVARSRRALAAYNDLQSDAGRARLAVADPAYDQAGRLEAWLQAVAATADLPAVLAAAIGLDAWLTLEPSEHQGEFGFLLAATLLRQRGLASAHLPALALGLRASRWRWRPERAPQVRLAGLLAAMCETARAGHADLDRLTLTRAVMLAKCAGKSKNSRLLELVALFTAAPLVTVQAAAKALKVSPQGVEAMLAQLGTARPPERSGRKRYRAWGIL